VRAPRAAAGGSGNEPPSGFRAGEVLICRVLEPRSGGYSVSVQRSKLPAFMNTNMELELGAEVAGVFLCIHRQLILLNYVCSITCDLSLSAEAEPSE
jgi:hypothetical protein